MNGAASALHSKRGETQVLTQVDAQRAFSDRPVLLQHLLNLAAGIVHRFEESLEGCMDIRDL